MTSSLPILALDIGLKRTGVAITESGLACTPLQTIQWEAHPDQLIREIVALVEAYEVKTVLFGVPKNEDGSTTPQYEKTAALIEKITLELPPNVAILEQNEFASSQDGIAKYTDLDRDAAAAMIILERYLEEVF